MYYKVFINNTETAFSSAPLEAYNTVSEIRNIESFYEYVESNKRSKINVVDADGSFWKLFSDQHQTVKAAGGLVLNEQGQLLVIKRNGLWDLPKGKMEDGESIEETALREVEEECGIRNLELIDQLPDTFHTYELNNKRILKRTFWFFMNCEGVQNLVPQLEEGITEVRFVDNVEIEDEILLNTYASLEPLFNAYLVRNK